jgi:hypothetical protein
MGSTVERAWEAFLAAIADAKELTASGGSAGAIQDLLQHARELLDIIDDEIALNGLGVPADVRSGLEHLRRQLTAVETGLVTPH